MSKRVWLQVAAVVGGALVWELIVQATGRREAWDTGIYFTVGIPAVCVLAMALAMIEPATARRWGMLPFVGQFAWMMVSQGDGGLWPLGLAFFAVLSVPAIIAARFAASVAVRRGRGG